MLESLDKVLSQRDAAREDRDYFRTMVMRLTHERDHLRALLREVQDLIPDYWDGRYDELCDRIDAALEGRDGEKEA